MREPLNRQFGLMSRKLQRARSACGARGARAFTLIEILIVVVILGIMAMIVIPQFSNASHQARENTLKDDMRFLRLQVQVFAAQHRDVPPGYPGGSTSAVPTEADFEAQMTLHTSEDCSTSATSSPVYKYGPYLSRLPINPISNQAGVYVVPNGTAMPAAASLPVMNGGVPYGWIYKPQTQEFMVNLAGSDSNGTPFANY
jgi:prepilin-type N-terminal cleavage/methylation domain-containing protein